MSETVYRFNDNCLLELMDGIPLAPRVTPPEYFKSLRDMHLGPDDVLVTSYPKSGTIWTMTTIAAIMSADKLDEFENVGPDFVRIPVELKQFTELYSNVSHPTVVYSHLRLNMIPKCNKIIQVQRNPKDIATSLFCYAKLMPSLHEIINNWDNFVYSFCHQNNLPYGNWFDYMKDWLQKRKDPNKLFIQYEDFVADPIAMIRKLAAFLDKHLTEDQIERIAQNMSFDSMQNNPKLDHHLAGAYDKTKGRFLWKGKVGDWHKHFTDDQTNAFDAFYQNFAEEHNLELKFDR